MWLKVQSRFFAFDLRHGNSLSTIDKNWQNNASGGFTRLETLPLICGTGCNGRAFAAHGRSWNDQREIGEVRQDRRRFRGGKGLSSRERERAEREEKKSLECLVRGGVYVYVSSTLWWLQRERSIVFLSITPIRAGLCVCFDCSKLQGTDHLQGHSFEFIQGVQKKGFVQSKMQSWI